jgi:hypothetical protein
MHEMEQARHPAVVMKSSAEVEMGTSSRRLKEFVGVAAMAAALYVLPDAATAATGGTIYFSGAIVAPPFGVSYAPAVEPSAAGTTIRQISGAAGVRVTFDAPVGVVGASIALQALGGDGLRAPRMIAARFVDGAGHTVASGKDGRFRLGREGGTLSLTPQAGNGPSADRAVVVAISYD